MNMLSTILIPIIVLGIIMYGVYKKVDIYESFLEGAKEGLITTFHIFPSIIAMIFAVNVFLRSNVIDVVLGWLSPVFNLLHVPISVLPMTILRPISGTASLAILNDLLRDFGPDSFVGRLASTLQGCTDTTIYVLALYFGSIKVTKTKHALKAGLFADLCGIVASFVIVWLFFGS